MTKLCTHVYLYYVESDDACGFVGPLRFYCSKVRASSIIIITFDYLYSTCTFVALSLSLSLHSAPWWIIFRRCDSRGARLGIVSRHGAAGVVVVREHFNAPAVAYAATMTTTTGPALWCNELFDADVFVWIREENSTRQQFVCALCVSYHFFFLEKYNRAVAAVTRSQHGLARAIGFI